jgi:sigma-B regulation protein RsbU (phosphoserine phosphatase)
MQNSDSAGTRTARISTAEVRAVATAVTDPYIREQLEKRHEELATVLSSPRAVGTARLHELLHEVDSALERMVQGTYGVCEVCHDTVERERLIADPLVRLCLDHLTIEDRRALEGDLELAARIQRGLLPHTDVRSLDWHILYDYKPAGLVSGDYCDLISPSGEHPGLMFLLGDVSGKGVAASLLMSHLHAMFRSLAGAGLELDKLLEVANRIFCESTIAGQYATLICGRVRKGGEIEIASAGHSPALHAAKDGMEQISSTGVPLGMFSTSQYEVERIRLQPGESLLLYTDGVSEARDSAGNEYGIAALSRLAGRGDGWQPQELLAACLKDVQNFSAGGARQADDQTLMVIHRVAPAELA